MPTQSRTWKWSDLRAKVELESPRTDQSPPELTGVSRPPVDVSNDALAAELAPRRTRGKGQLAGIFRRGDMLVQTRRIGEHGCVPSNVSGSSTLRPAHVRPITTIGIKSLIEARHELEERHKRKRMRVPAMFPQQSAQSARDARLGEHAPNLKDLHGVTQRR